MYDKMHIDLIYINTDFPNMDCNGRHGLGNCSNMCLRGSEGPVCKCGDGVNLQPNQMTCENGKTLYNI